MNACLHVHVVVLPNQLDVHDRIKSVFGLY